MFFRKSIVCIFKNIFFKEIVEEYEIFKVWLSFKRLLVICNEMEINLFCFLEGWLRVENIFNK